MAHDVDAIADFWALFRRRKDTLANAKSADNAVYDELLQQLHQVDAGLYLEFSLGPRPRELIVTAEGKRSLFELARRIVRAAPIVDGWTILALKPKIGFPVTACWEGLTLRVAELVFDTLVSKGRRELGLRIFVPGLKDEDTDAAHNAVLRAMDHGLGEERLAEAIGYTEVRSLPAGVSAGDFIPLSQLDAFIEWWERKQREIPAN
jgi:hypothetical protein